jgi:predicted outer membrane lipoprotein
VHRIACAFSTITALPLATIECRKAGAIRRAGLNILAIPNPRSGEFWGKTPAGHSDPRRSPSSPAMSVTPMLRPLPLALEFQA